MRFYTAGTHNKNVYKEETEAWCFIQMHEISRTLNPPRLSAFQQIGHFTIFARCLFSVLTLGKVLLSLAVRCFGECCEMMHEFFVRVLHSSRVILTM